VCLLNHFQLGFPSRFRAVCWGFVGAPPLGETERGGNSIAQTPAGEPVDEWVVDFVSSITDDF